MNKERHMLLKLFLPVLVINVLNVTVVYSADKAEDKIAQNKVMPSPPAGPYRSVLDVMKETKTQPQMHTQSMHQQNMRQQNMAKQENTKQDGVTSLNTQQWMPPTPPQWMQSQGKQPQHMPAPTQPTPNFNNRQWTPPVRPQWNQQYPRPQMAPPQSAPNFNNRQWTPPVPPQWNQSQRGPIPPQAGPNFNNRQWNPPVPPQWNQQRQVNPPNSQYRRW